MKFGFVTWDWKQSEDRKSINALKTAIGGETEVTEFDTGCDCFSVAVHSVPTTIDKDEWLELLNSTGYVDFDEKFEIERPMKNGLTVYEATDEQLREYMAETRRLEEEGEEQQTVETPVAAANEVKYGTAAAYYKNVYGKVVNNIQDTFMFAEAYAKYKSL